MRRAFFAMTALFATPAVAEGPLPASIPIAGPKSEVVTIASTHLSAFDHWTAPMLEPVVEKLAAFRPQIVTHEGLSGEQCESFKSNPAIYGEVYDTYCWNPDGIIGSTRLSVPQATMKVNEVLARWPTAPTAAQRRHLAMLFLAAGDRESAYVQWLRLAPADRKAGDGLSDGMIEVLTRKGKRLNESFHIAAAVAARAGLDRVYAVDDHSSDATVVDLGPTYEEDQLKRWNSPQFAKLKARFVAQMTAVRDPESMLALYREMNAPGAQREQVEADFGGALSDSSPNLSGRQYFGWWETRNLRMVANIRAAFAARPGARVMNIVGSSHKPWYDALLAAMPDVTVADAAAVLR